MNCAKNRLSSCTHTARTFPHFVHLGAAFALLSSFVGVFVIFWENGYKSVTSLAALWKHHKADPPSSP